MKKTKVFYAAGPGDVIGTYSFWKKNQEDPCVIWKTDSSQFYDWVKEVDAEAMVISYCQREAFLQDGAFTLQQIPKKHYRGILYHLYQVWYGIMLCLKAIKFKADIAIIEEGMSHWFVFYLLCFSKIAVIPSLKCTLWPPFLPLSKTQRILNFLNRKLFQRYSIAILSISKKISEQVFELTHDRHSPVYQFLTIYPRDYFATIAPPRWEQRPFNLLFVGRVVKDKGIFDLVEIAKKLELAGLDSFHIHICGLGSDLPELSKRIGAAGLSSRFTYHGYCDQTKLKEMFSLCHAVIVPTKKTFIEGLPNIVIEGVLAKRPVITSAVCPAIDYVLPAIVEVLPEDIEGYSCAIVQLYRDKLFFESKSRACYDLEDQFYDTNNSWHQSLVRAVAK